MKSNEVIIFRGKNVIQKEKYNRVFVFKSVHGTHARTYVCVCKNFIYPVNHTAAYVCVTKLITSIIRYFRICGNVSTVINFIVIVIFMYLLVESIR